MSVQKKKFVHDVITAQITWITRWAIYCLLLQ